MPESPPGCVSSQSTRSSKSPYAFRSRGAHPCHRRRSPPSRYRPASAGRDRRSIRSVWPPLLGRELGLDVRAEHAAPPGRPRQPLRSLPLKRTVKPPAASARSTAHRSSRPWPHTPASPQPHSQHSAACRSLLDVLSCRAAAKRAQERVANGLPRRTAEHDSTPTRKARIDQAGRWAAMNSAALMVSSMWFGLTATERDDGPSNARMRRRRSSDRS